MKTIINSLVASVIVVAATLAPVAVSAQSQQPSQVKASTQSELKGQTNQWSEDNTAKAGETLKYIVNYQNTGTTEQKQVVVRDTLPDKVKIVPGTTMVYNSSFPDGIKADTDTVTANEGVKIGNYMPGANAYVTFEATIATADQLACGDNVLTNTAFIKAEGQTAETTVKGKTTVKRECAAAPAPAPTPTPPAAETKPAAPAPAPAPTPAATTPVAPAANAEALPKTGPSDIFAIFGIAAIAGFIGHKLMLRRMAR